MVDGGRFVEVATVVRSVLPENAFVEALEVDDNRVRRPSSIAIDRGPDVVVRDDVGTLYEACGYSGGGGGEGARFVWEFRPAPPAGAAVLFVSNASSADGLPIVVPLR